MRILKRCIKTILLLVVVISTLAVVLFGHSDIPVDQLKPKYANADSSFLSLDGMKVHYRDEGQKADSIPVVLLHGTASSLHTFDAWASTLKKTHRVVRIDLPGYGLTGPFPHGNYDMPSYSEFLNHFLTALNIKSCVLAGNSLGGEIAWNFTTAHAERIEKLILIDAAGFPLHSKSIPIGFKMAQIPIVKNIFTYITPRFIVESSVENVFYDPSKVTEELVDRYYELTLREGNRQAFVDRFKRSDINYSYEKLRQIQQPTLVIWGSEDLLIPLENAYRFQQYLPNSTLIIIENSGHTPMEESPVESLGPVIDFLNNSIIKKFKP